MKVREVIDKLLDFDPEKELFIKMKSVYGLDEYVFNEIIEIDIEDNPHPEYPEDLGKHYIRTYGDLE